MKKRRQGRRKSVLRAVLQACLCHPDLEEMLGAYQLVRREVWVRQWSERLSLDSRWQEALARNSVVPSMARSGQREKPWDQRRSVGIQGSDPDTHHILFLFPEQPLPSCLKSLPPFTPARLLCPKHSPEPILTLQRIQPSKGFPIACTQ